MAKCEAGSVWKSGKITTAALEAEASRHNEGCSTEGLLKSLVVIGFVMLDGFQGDPHDAERRQPLAQLYD